MYLDHKVFNILCKHVVSYELNLMRIEYWKIFIKHYN
jgi:hypothetical protein